MLPFSVTIAFFLVLVTQSQAFQRYSTKRSSMLMLTQHGRAQTPLSSHRSLTEPTKLYENENSNYVVQFTTPFKPSPQLALLTHLSNHGWFKHVFNALVLLPLLTSRLKRWVQQPIVFPNRSSTTLPSADTSTATSTPVPPKQIKDAHVKGYINLLAKTKLKLHSYLTNYNLKMSPGQLPLPFNGKEPTQQGLLGLFLRTQMVRAGLKRKPTFRRRVINAAVESLQL